MKEDAKSTKNNIKINNIEFDVILRSGSVVFYREVEPDKYIYISAWRVLGEEITEENFDKYLERAKKMVL